jgi:hypothetical protein
MNYRQLSDQIAAEVKKYNAEPFDKKPRPEGSEPFYGSGVVHIPLVMRDADATRLLRDLVDNHGFNPTTHLTVRKDRVTVWCAIGATRDACVLRGNTNLMAVYDQTAGPADPHEVHKTLTNGLLTTRSYGFDGLLIEV